MGGERRNRAERVSTRGPSRFFDLLDEEIETFPIDDVRHVAVGTLNSVTKSWLRISQNGSHGDGGTCFGDSGGARTSSGPAQARRG